MYKRIFKAIPLLIMQLVSFVFILTELTNGVKWNMFIGILLVLIINFSLLEIYRLIAEDY